MQVKRQARWSEILSVSESHFSRLHSFTVLLIYCATLVSGNREASPFLGLRSDWLFKKKKEETLYLVCEVQRLLLVADFNKLSRF